MAEPITSTAYLAIMTALLKMVSPLQDAIYKHLDRRSKRKREMADVLSEHLSSISRLFKRSATLLKQRDTGNQLGTVCAQLHTEVEILDKKVMGKLLPKRLASQFLKEGHNAAAVEQAGYQLLNSGVRDLSPYVSGLETASGMFRGLAEDAKRKGTAGGS
jgi:hypothetical protein